MTGECAHPLGSACNSSERQLRLQAPPGAGCPATRVCPATWKCLHLILEGAETTSTTQGRVPSDRECASDRGVSVPHL